MIMNILIVLYDMIRQFGKLHPIACYWILCRWQVATT